MGVRSTQEHLTFTPQVVLIIKKLYQTLKINKKKPSCPFYNLILQFLGVGRTKNGNIFIKHQYK